MNLSLLLDHGPTDAGRWLVRALLRIEGVAPASERAPVNIALVLDRSGSMSGAKLDAARAAALHVAQRLSPDDIIGVVAYDDSVVTIAPAERVKDHAGLHDRIRAIYTGGSTNLSGGWLRGRELVARRKDQHAVNRILLLTDGLANVGIKDPAQLAAVCAHARDIGITTTTIGFGTDYDEDLLRSMADAGGGYSWYIESPDQAPAVFAQEIDGLLDTCAQNLAVTIETGTGTRLIAVHHSYPSMQDGSRLRLDIGDLYAAEPRSVLVEFVLDSLPHEPVTIGTVRTTAAVFDTDGSLEARTIDMPIVVSAADGPVTSAEVRRELLLLEAARVREQAMEDGRRGDARSAGEKLMEMSYRLRESFADPEMLREADDLEAIASTLSLAAMSAADLKYLHQRAKDARRGRTRASEVIARGRKKPPEDDA